MHNNKTRYRNLKFSEIFEVKKEILEQEGFVDISLLCDLPLFIDPFLIFGNNKQEYTKLNEEINKYLLFLKDKAINYDISKGLLKSWFTFSEISNNWLGYCKFGNKGSGLGDKFAKSLYYNLKNKLNNFGNSEILKVDHIEKLCLIDDNIGSDNISDFVVNIIKGYFLDKTQSFAHKYLNKNYCDYFNVEKAYFNYDLEKWMPKTYYLPSFNGDYLILTPIDMLTKDSSWLNKDDMIERFSLIVEKIPNEQLKFEINNYLSSLYKKNMTNDEQKKNRLEVIKKYPVLIDYYLLEKEKTIDEALDRSIEKSMFIDDTLSEMSQVLINSLMKTSFYNYDESSYEEAKKRTLYLKKCIEDNDAYKIFYDDDGNIRLKKEEDLQLLFRLTCYNVISDVNRECNNGRGPVDYKFSKASLDKSLIEFKLAGNSKLKQNLKKQVEIYEKANDTKKSIKVILFFTEKEKEKVDKILKELKLTNDDSIVLIDAINNKVSASKAK